MCACTAGVGSVFGPDADVDPNDPDNPEDITDDTPLIPLRSGIELTYAAAIGYGDMIVSGELVVRHVGMVADDGRDYFLIEREFTASDAGADDPADYAFTEQRYYVFDGGEIALHKGEVSYPSTGQSATSVYNPADLRFDRRILIEPEHSWSTLGTVTIISRQGDTSNEQTLDYRSYFEVGAASERPMLDGTHQGWTIAGTHHYGEETVDVDAFCALDLGVGYRAIVPNGQVGRPVTQELIAVTGL
jgi:hypothetical protein